MLPEIIRTREALEDCAALMMRAATAVARAEGAVRTEIQCNQVAAYGGAAEARKTSDARPVWNTTGHASPRAKPINTQIR